MHLGKVLLMILITYVSVKKYKKHIDNFWIKKKQNKKKNTFSGAMVVKIFELSC